MFERLIRNESIYNAAIGIFLAISLLMLFGRTEWWPQYYAAHFFAGVFIISALFIRLSKYAFETTDECFIPSAYFLRFVIMFSLAVNAAGELYFYQLYRFGFQFDKLAHFGNSLLFVLALARYGQARFVYDFSKALKISVFIVIIFSFGWELTEFLSDKIFKTQEFGIYGQLKTVDTALDLIFDFLGMIAAGIYLNSSGYKQRAADSLCAFTDTLSAKRRNLHQGKLL